LAWRGRVRWWRAILTRRRTGRRRAVLLWRLLAIRSLVATLRGVLPLRGRILALRRRVLSLRRGVLSMLLRRVLALWWRWLLVVASLLLLRRILALWRILSLRRIWRRAVALRRRFCRIVSSVSSGRIRMKNSRPYGGCPYPWYDIGCGSCRGR
jgi:hypothetical protein